MAVGDGGAADRRRRLWATKQGGDARPRIDLPLTLIVEGSGEFQIQHGTQTSAW
jgi:hypothetical protein